MFLPWVRKKLLADPHRLGRWGQNKAETFLKRQRLRTLARNFSFSGGELDLVMGDSNGTIVFVEVKTRRDETFMPAVTTVAEALYWVLQPVRGSASAANPVYLKSGWTGSPI
ncbi:MAG: YraN family protein, partial [Anaerohalosphaeraceae bacterium]